MSSPLLPAFDFVESTAPSLSPLAAFEVSHEHVRLGLSGIGSIDVSHGAITVLAPDDVAYRRTVDRLGEWAQAQWLAAQGFRVMRGAVVARHGKALALIGGSRCGASVLALVISRRGWGLISDGLVIIDANGIARALDSVVTLDTDATVGLPTDVPISPLTTGRNRVLVRTRGHADAPIAGYAFLRVQQSLTQLAFESVPFSPATSEAVEDYTIRPLVTALTTPPALAQAPTWRVARPVGCADPNSYSPPALAQLLMPAFDAEVG